MPSVHVVKAVSQLRVSASYAAFLWWQFPSWENEGLPDVNIWIALTSDRHVNGDDWRNTFRRSNVWTDAYLAAFALQANAIGQRRTCHNEALRTDLP